MSLILYQFPISHYCEKVRWALDYKGVPYEVRNLMPGQHVKVTKKLAAKSSVPVLVHDGKAIQGSEKIITYLDQQFPERKLTPVNPQEMQAAMEWERYLDLELGVHVRRYAYQTLLQHPAIVVPMLAAGQSFWKRLYLRLIFGKLSKVMRKLMDINPASAEASKQRILAALERMDAALDGNKYLVGNRFSRADLTAAALLAPLFMPPQYGLSWPKTTPDPLGSDLKKMAGQLAWAKGVYEQLR